MYNSLRRKVTQFTHAVHGLCKVVCVVIISVLLMCTLASNLLLLSSVSHLPHFKMFYVLYFALLYYSLVSHNLKLVETCLIAVKNILIHLSTRICSAESFNVSLIETVS